jgi:DNA-binding NtrC family response regulator
VRSVSPQTIFILMTGYASVDSAIEAFRGGAHDYILKPVVLEDVLQKVKRLLEAKSLAWEVELLRRQVNCNFRIRRADRRKQSRSETFFQ